MSNELTQTLLDRKHFFTIADVNTDDNGYYEGKILVISNYKVDGFPEKYRNPQNQLFVAFGGFGCSPTTMGHAVFGRFLSDGEECRMNRNDFIGVLKNEVAYELGYCPCGNYIEECNCHE